MIVEPLWGLLRDQVDELEGSYLPDHDTRIFAQQILAMLTADERELIEAIAFHERSGAEIARELGLHRSVIHRRLKRIRMKLCHFRRP